MEFIGKAEFWQSVFIIIQTGAGIALPIIGGWILWLRGKKSQKILQAQIETNKENIELTDKSNTALQESYSRLLEDYGFIKDLLLATRKLADELQIANIKDKEVIDNLENKVGKLEYQLEQDRVTIIERDAKIETKDRLIASHTKKIKDMESQIAERDAVIEQLKKRIEMLERRVGSGPLGGNENANS